jgi:hypothetical protein
MPPYLLNRAYDASSIDSDGASRIFMNTHSTITTAKDTDSSATSNISYSSSSFSMSSISSISNVNSNARRNAYQPGSSSAISSIYDESSDSRTIRSETQSNFDETHSSLSNRGLAHKVSIPPSISYMDTLYTGPVCLSKSDGHTTNFSSGYDDISATYTDPSNMFTPYISLFPVSNRELEQREQEKNASRGLFLIINEIM